VHRVTARAQSIPLASTTNGLPSIGLIERCVAGDLDAREELAYFCIPRIRKSVFFMTRDDRDIDDITQTVLLMVFSGLSGFSGRAQFTTWLDRVTLNAVRQHFRAKQSKSWLLFSDELVKPQTPEKEQPDKRLEEQYLIRRLSRIMQCIRSEKRIALLLNAAYGYNAREIAGIVGCSPEAAKKRLQHGRKELFKKLKEDNYLITALKKAGHPNL
jgi:RNA polymerase sigma-70 factor (ECF subfamily)